MPPTPSNAHTPTLTPTFLLTHTLRDPEGMAAVSRDPPVQLYERFFSLIDISHVDNLLVMFEKKGGTRNYNLLSIEHVPFKVEMIMIKHYLNLP